MFDSSKLIFKRKKNIYISCTAGYIRVREFEIQQLEGTAWVSCIVNKKERMKIL